MVAYLNARTGAERDHPCVVFLSTHCVAVSGGVFCDVFSLGEVVDIDDAKGRRKKVSRVLVLTTRVAPSPIASLQPVPNAAKAGANSKTKAIELWAADPGMQINMQDRHAEGRPRLAILNDQLDELEVAS